MALNFTAGQYEKAFSPTKLCNWGVAKKSVEPKKLNDVTKIIVDDRGHLLPGLRKYTKNPWAGLFHNTYHLPRKSTRKRADDMAHGDILTSWEKRSAHVPVIADPQQPSPKQCRNHSSTNKENKAVNNTDLPNEAQPITATVASSCRSASPSVCSNKSTNVLQDIKNHPDPEERNKPRDEKFENEPILTDMFTNELVAKNLRLSNQKHHRLPDAVDNSSYNALQMKRDSNPGLSLNVDPTSSAIGCKVFHSPGPTQCSKLKVFRPHTAPKEIKKQESDRPKTTSRIKKKSKPLSEMDLAIYWDIPASAEMKNYENPAPAVFAVVPADDYRKDIADAEVPSLIGSDNSSEAKAPSKKQHTNPSAVMDVINVQPTHSDSPRVSDVSDKAKKQSPTPTECAKLSKSHSSISSLNSQQSRKNYSKNESANATKTFDNFKPIKTPSPPHSWDGAQKRSKSSPNLANVGVQVNASKLGRPCVACELKRCQTSGKIERDQYKSAFKAGKLNNYTVDREAMERIHKSKHLRVPKPKTPFARKNYSIGTLAPPFSIWPRTGGHDYPDHWRLASIYQHSYKPLETRKGPLIKTVFQ